MKKENCRGIIGGLDGGHNPLLDDEAAAPVSFVDVNIMAGTISESLLGRALALLSEVGEFTREGLRGGGAGNDDNVGEETSWTESSVLWRFFRRAKVAVRGDHAAEKAFGEDGVVAEERVEEESDIG